MPFIVPVIGAIGTALGTVGSFIAGLGFTAKMVIGIGINVASMLIQRAQAKKQQKDVAGVQINRQYGGDVPRQVAVGLVGIAGHDCYVNTYSISNSLLQQIYSLSDYPIDGMSRVAINGKYVTLGSVADPDKGYPVTSGDFANLIWIKTVDGRQTVADDYLVDNANPAGRWTEDHIGVGIAHVIVSMTYDREKNSQFPDFFFEFRGARLYDWRKDSTNGGSGSHRYTDPSTHEFNENPIVAEYNYRRGFAINGDVFCGMEMTAAELPVAKWTAAANICDELDVEDNEPRYRLSLMLDCTATHKENIEAMALACGAMSIDGVDGSWPIVGTEQPVVATFTDDDIIATTSVKFRAKRSMSQLINSVSGTFPDPDQLWGMVGYETQIASAFLALDRRTRDLGINFKQVRHARQAEQLAHIYLYENRYEASATVTLRPRFQVIESGDWVRWNSARYGDRIYIVQANSLAPLEDENGPRNITLTLQERDGSIYDGVTPAIPVVPVPPGQAVYLEQVENFQLTPVKVIGDTGREQAGIRASWNSINDVTVNGVFVRYWPTSDPTNVVTKQVPFDQITLLLTEGVVSLTEYMVSTRLDVNIPRVVAWATPVSVITLDAATDFYPIDISRLDEDLKGYTSWIGDGLREIERRLEEIDLLLADQDFGNAFDRQVLKTKLTAKFDNSIASWSNEIVVLTSQTQALVSDVTELSAQVDDPVTGLSGLATAISATQTSVSVVQGEVAAQATAITALSASSDPNNVNEANFMMDVFAGPTGYSRIGARTRQGGTGSWRGAAWYLDTPNNPALPTRFVVDAEQFIVSDGSATLVQPLVWTGGVLYAPSLRVEWANIQNVVIGWANISNAVINNFVATSANIGNLAVTAAKIGNLEVTTGKIAANAITSSDDDSGSISTSGGTWTAGNGAWQTIASITVSSDSGNPILAFHNTQVLARSSGQAQPTATASMRILRGSTVVLGPYTVTQTGGGSSADALLDRSEFVLVPVPSVGSYTLNLQVSKSTVGTANSTATTSLVAQCNRK